MTRLITDRRASRPGCRGICHLKTDPERARSEFCCVLKNCALGSYDLHQPDLCIIERHYVADYPFRHDLAVGSWRFEDELVVGLAELQEPMGLCGLGHG
jgi:hypothetical protein